MTLPGTPQPGRFGALFSALRCALVTRCISLRARGMQSEVRS